MIESQFLLEEEKEREKKEREIERERDEREVEKTRKFSAIEC